MPALLDKTRWTKLQDSHYEATGSDVWLLKGSGYGRTGAVRIMAPKPEIVNMWLDDIANCKTCQEGTPVKHGTTAIFNDGSLYTYQCRSFSRAIDPTKGELVGTAHCTCDACW